MSEGLYGGGRRAVCRATGLIRLFGKSEGTQVWTAKDFLFSCHLLKRQAVGVGLQRLSESSDYDWAGSGQATVKCGSESGRSSLSHAQKPEGGPATVTKVTSQTPSVAAYQFGDTQGGAAIRQGSGSLGRQLPEESRLANENGRNGVC